MLQLAAGPRVRTYCEIGMNGGHSLTAMLLANHRLTAQVFDALQWMYSAPILRLLNFSFPERIQGSHSAQEPRASSAQCPPTAWHCVHYRSASRRTAGGPRTRCGPLCARRNLGDSRAISC